MNLTRLLAYAKRLYSLPLMLERDPIDVQFRGEVPDVMKSDDYEKQEDSGLYLPAQQKVLQAKIGGYTSYSYKFAFTTTPPLFRLLKEDAEAKPEEPQFEVNMMEALVGWKAFMLVDGNIQSASQGTVWPPCEALKAECECREYDFVRYDGSEYPRLVCKNTPQEYGQCGIYAAGLREAADRYCYEKSAGRSFFSTPSLSPHAFLAEIYGWGRYVRGDSGWRSQFAYPKCFYLRPSQVEFIDTLRAFHVPIYIEQPVQVYDPQEDGYSEYRQNEKNWNLGTAEDSNPTEDRGTDA